MNSVKNNIVRFRAGAGFFLMFLPLAFFSAACNQNAIFYTISQEVKLREPYIKGTPSNIVVFDNDVYVANRFTLYRYGKPGGSTGDPEWNSGDSLQPGGEIIGLAATNNDLFVLTRNGLKRYDKDTLSWQDVRGDETDADAQRYADLQTIYADEGRLFAGAGNGDPTSTSDNYAILYLEGNTLKSLKTGVRLLSGAAYNGTDHFVSTLGSGIFAVSESPVALTGPLSNSENSADTNREVTGIINLKDANMVVAVDRNGEILEVTAAGFTVRAKGIGIRTTGALALWRSPPDPASPPPSPDSQKPQLLLVGIQGTLSATTQTYYNGYREIELDESGGLPPDFSINVPGTGGVPSISNSERYTSSLGKLPIYHLFQVPYTTDPVMPIFASTNKEGLWSYRDHEKNGDVHWNAE